MRGILSICTFAALGMIVASIIFGFTLGALFSGRDRAADVGLHPVPDDRW